MGDYLHPSSCPHTHLLSIKKIELSFMKNRGAGGRLRRGARRGGNIFRTVGGNDSIIPQIRKLKRFIYMFQSAML